MFKMPSPTLILPLPEGGGGNRRGRGIRFEHLVIRKFEFVSNFEIRDSNLFKILDFCNWNLIGNWDLEFGICL